MTQADRLKKHLHGRGEDPVWYSPRWIVVETPPRTWRRLRLSIAYLFQIGNTSTDVEKTACMSPSPPGQWKHLHGRGEDSDQRTGSNRVLETPPRTWRRRQQAQGRKHRCGNTSTDVEKTSAPCRRQKGDRKHLHGRGEDRAISRAFNRCWETPPRTWRRRKKRSTGSRTTRNTSTDVEKTEYSRSVVLSMLETPPRTWRRLSRSYTRHSHRQKHLHGRGEDAQKPASQGD